MSKPRAYSRKESRHDVACTMLLVNLEFTTLPPRTNRDECWRHHLEVQREEVMTTGKRIVQQILRAEFITGE